MSLRLPEIFCSSDDASCLTPAMDAFTLSGWVTLSDHPDESMGDSGSSTIMTASPFQAWGVVQTQLDARSKMRELQIWTWPQGLSVWHGMWWLEPSPSPL